MSIAVEVGASRIEVPRPPVSVGRMANQLVVAFFDEGGYPTLVRPDGVPAVPDAVAEKLTDEQQEKYKQDAAIAIDIAFFADRLTRSSQQEALRSLDYTYTDKRSNLTKVCDRIFGTSLGQLQADHAILQYHKILSWYQDAHLVDPSLEELRMYRDLAQDAGGDPLNLKASFDLGLETFRDTTRDLSAAYFRNRSAFTVEAPDVLRNSMPTIRAVAAMSLLKNLSIVGKNGNFRRFMIPGEKDGKEFIALDKARMARRISALRIVSVDPRVKARTNNACPALAPISIPGAALVKALETMYIQQIDVLEDVGAWKG